MRQNTRRVFNISTMHSIKYVTLPAPHGETHTSMALKSRKIAVMGFRAVGGCQSTLIFVAACAMCSAPLGKSSLVIQFVEGQFVDSYEPTIESSKFWYHPHVTSFHHRFILVMISFIAFEKRAKFRGQDFRIQLVDTAGQVCPPPSPPPPPPPRRCAF